MSTRTKEEVQEIWEATLAPHRKSNRPPRLTKKEKKLIKALKNVKKSRLRLATVSRLAISNKDCVCLQAKRV